MAKRNAGAKPMKAAEREKIGKAVRLILSAVDHERLEQAARAKGLSMASYARMSVLAALKVDEGK